MKTGEIYRFAFNTEENRVLFYPSKNDAILNRNASIPKRDVVNKQAFTVLDCDADPFDSNELIVFVLYSNKRFYIRYRTDKPISWNQVKRLRDE